MLDSCLLIIFKLFALVLSYLPRRMGRQVCRGIIALIFILLPRLKTASMRNLELAFPARSEAERQEIESKAREILAENLYSSFVFPELLREEPLEFEDFERYKLLLEEVRRAHPNTGIILANMHCGCFELTVQYHCLHDRPVRILARGFGLKKVDEWFNDRRARLGNEVFFRKGGYNAMVRSLAAGKDVGLLFDQNVKANHAIFVDLFNHKASMTKSVALAALRVNAPIVFVSGVWLGGRRHRMYFKKINTEFSTELTSEEKVQRISQELTTVGEQVIRQHPEQWFWVHRRFKTRPPGELEKIYS